LENRLTLNGISVRRGENIVLSDIHWTVRLGENWAVLGANGAGKSSLAAALAGEAATSGDIEYGFGGNDPCARVASVSFSLHRAFLAQGDGYYQSRWYPGEEDATLTARRILLGGRRGAAAHRHVESVARTMGIGRMLDRQALHLSTGEMRRLLIARALLIHPELLVLDEPFIGLDVGVRAALSKILARLMRGGLQIIFLTARPWELPDGITHSLWLKDGEVLGAAKHGSAQAKKLERVAFPRAKKLSAMIPAGHSKQPAPKSDVIELRDVTLRAGESVILKDVNWTVRAGQRWAVAGPNGAGKTTLLSLLIGDHPQSYAQHVRLFGKLRGEGETLWELKAKMGWASPDIALHYDTLTSTLDFVCTGFFETLGLYRQCTPAQERVARQWIRYFGLSSAAQRPFRQLSDGQQRLALLARALVKRPRLLILDEPCQGLDVVSRDRVLKAIESLCHSERSTLVMVTHYSSELPPSISHRMELRKGEVPRKYEVRRMK